MRSKTRSLLATAGVLAVAGGMFAFNAHNAQAATPLIVAGTGSSVSCDITALAKFNQAGAPVALKNDWKHSDHTAAKDPGHNSKTNTDGDPAVKAAVDAIPDTKFSVNNPVTTSSKGKGTCSGTFTDGVNSAAAVSVKFTGMLIATTPGPATCAGLITLGSDQFNSIISWKATGAKIADTTVTANLSTLIDADGVGFELKSGPSQSPPTPSSGSFAGGTGDTKAYLDAKTGPALLAGVTGPMVDSKNASNIKALNPCEPALKVKIPKNPPDSASIKAGKGLKKIGIGPAGVNIAGPGDGTPSTLKASKP